MINNVVLVGRLTKDAELRYTPSNVAVATFTLAVNRPYKNDAGEREADFINCVIWRQSAENLANWAKKGSLIGITGTIQTRNYENQQGQRCLLYKIIKVAISKMEITKVILEIREVINHHLATQLLWTSAMMICLSKIGVLYE